MGYTYNEILERMNDQFTESAGYEPQRAGDAEIRMKLLAGELYSLCTEIDRIKQQMFPNTATGEYLELHAAQRGLTRLKGDKASGMVVFRLDMPLDHDITIPKGTICSTADGSLRYITVNDDYVPRNSTFKLIECEAENSGEQYNVARNAVKVIITYFSVGISITNASTFTGGTNDETDDELRARIIESYRNTPNGANQEYYIHLAQSVDGIQSATVSGSMLSGGVTVCVGGKGALPSDEAYQKAHELLNVNRPFGIKLNVTRPELITVNTTVNISLKDGYNANEVIVNVRKNITDFFNALSVGESLKLAALGKAVYESDGVDNYSFTNMSDVEISNSQLAKLGTVSISADES